MIHASPEIDKTSLALKAKEMLIRMKKKGEITMYIDGEKVRRVTIKQEVE